MDLLNSKKIQELLKTHSSTAERLEYYPELKKLISKMKAKSILDLGCGLNPIALASSKIKYYAADIKEDELDLIKKYFSTKNIKGKTFIYDLTKIDNKLPKTDLCIMFKVLDVIDHRITEKIITRVKCKKILVSFSSKKTVRKTNVTPKENLVRKNSS